MLKTDSGSTVKCIKLFYYFKSDLFSLFSLFNITFISLGKKKKKLIGGFGFAPFPVALILIWAAIFIREKKKKEKRRKPSKDPWE